MPYDVFFKRAVAYQQSNLDYHSSFELVLHHTMTNCSPAALEKYILTSTLACFARPTADEGTSTFSMVDTATKFVRPLNQQCALPLRLFCYGYPSAHLCTAFVLRPFSLFSYVHYHYSARIPSSVVWLGFWYCCLFWCALIFT
mmetsp:Transcript_35912/g.64210  ORF Transcript_35912/g.64210 Transcript_35912/m.64210 type:complete len:143 (-) Transcript_35912:281-709(-)